MDYVVRKSKKAYGSGNVLRYYSIDCYQLEHRCTLVFCDNFSLSRISNFRFSTVMSSALFCG